MSNCARQHLAHEFPEVANRKSYRQKPDDLPALWGWLAELRLSPYFDRMWLKSVAQDFGLEISEFTRAASRRICDIESQESLIEKDIQQHLGDYVDKLKIGGTPAKVAQLRCCAKAARLLFQKLTR